MNQEYEVVDGVEVPVSPLLTVEKENRYGSVPGLDDEELADPDELERQVIKEEFGPLLLLPVAPRRGWIQAVVDESMGLTRGAFDSADYLDGQPDFDKLRYKAEKLREELKDLLIRIDIAKEHVPRRARYMVLKYLRLGVIDLEHIADFDMYHLATMVLRAERLRNEIAALKDKSERRAQAAYKTWLAALG